MNSASDAEELLLFGEPDTEEAETDQLRWQILIVDDDRDVHAATMFAFKNTLVFGRQLAFHNAHCAAEARAILRNIDDLAVILLDVVMEQADSGLRLVKEIREDFNLQDVRIILRTGQPGYAPEIDTIRDLDINDYKTKSELTRAKLYAALTAAVRSYDQISKINASRRGLDMIIRGSAELIALHGLREFASGVIVQLASMLNLPPEGLVCAQESPNPNGPAYIVMAAAGAYEKYINEPVSNIGCDTLVSALLKAIQSRTNHIGDDHSTLFIHGGNRGMAVYLKNTTMPSDVDLKLIEVFCSNIAICFDNVELFTQLREQAFFDAMVQLPNQTGFLDEIDTWLVKQPDRRRALALIDIDNFAEINDALGQQYGDLLLQAVAARLRHAFDHSVAVARVGGDVFGIFGDETVVRPEYLGTLFAAPFDIAEDRQSISTTIGLVRLNEIEGNASDAFKSASIALKQAKGYHRGYFSYFSRHLGTETRERVRLLRNLRSSFESERLFMHYQPQISLQTGTVIGLEALVRWRADDGQFVPPDAFIPLAERSGLIIPLGEWILRTACLFAHQLHGCGHTGLRMAVNVSAIQFRHPGFLDVLDRALAETAVDPACIELEITESVAMLDADLMIELIGQIKERGVQLAIDDFGTGFSSLSYLQRLKIDRLKIDRSFTSQIGATTEGKSIAAMIIDLGRSLGLVVIAEGVEAQEQLLHLRAMNCMEAQGFHFARPMDETTLRAWLGDETNAERIAASVAMTD